MTLAPPRLAFVGAAALAAVALVLGGAVLGSPDGAAESASSSAPVAAGADGSIEALQARLERVPGDYPGWATLGLLYVDRARVTADPSWFARAQGAIDRSLEVQPEQNSTALTSLATLQAAQHEFEAAVATARQALAINDFDATAYGVLADALTELGRYDEAAEALQRMVDVKPSFSALTRISYARELRGDVDGARTAMQQALDDATGAENAGFAALYLGELAWNYGGDVAAAADHYAEGLRRDPTSLPLQAAAAQAAVAQGRTQEALAGYEEVTSRVPVQEYLVEHGELLDSLGRAADAQAQFELVDVANTLLIASGSVVDLETALFEADHGSPEAALAAAQESYASRPGSIFAADALAWALHVSGRSEEALQYSEQALGLGVRPASFLFHKGMIEAALDRTADAQRDLQEALQVNPHFSVLHAATARETLAGLAG